MTNAQQISAYNRLQGMLNIIDELINVYNPSPATQVALRTVQLGLKDAQYSLNWNPREKRLSLVQSNPVTG